MENVVAFNNELSGLYDSKPPISKAKMAAITKAAMRAIKFYKHVVQSVEKFILKCKPEYKVPGLYVIDSIVRQSRQQFGPEKDVFAPRFARNITETFANLFRCAPDDKSRIIRVLNLWQKNSVFAPEVIQPIFDLADPNHPIYQLPPGTSASNAGLVLAGGSGAGMQDMSSTSNGLNMSNNAMDISMSGGGGGGVGMQHAGGSGGIMDDKLAGLPDLSNNNLKQLLQDPNVLRQLQTLQNFQKFKQQEEKQHKLNEMRLQEEAFEKHLQNVLKGTAGGSMSEANEYNKEVEFVSEEQKIEVINLDGNDSRSPTPERDRYKRNRRSSRSRSRSRSRDRRDRRSRRSRSRSRSRSPRSSNRRRSSRDRDRDRSNRDKERDREHDRERRKKGLPDLKKEHLSVCSTTLWVGHLSKLVYQEELSDTFGEFGDIVSIDQIVPRGCAFIVMNRRQDAYKAMQSLKNHKLQGRTITISWAAGKGVKSKEWKDYWDLDLGVTYIPWSKINDKTDFDSLEEGGMFDDDSMPSWMKDKINRNKNGKDKVAEQMPPTVPSGGPVSAGMLFGIDTTQPPPGPPPPGGPPPMAMPPMGMPGQFTMAPPMGAPPRMLGPMGMPIAGIHMPPNMVPGMPPMLGMMPPGFPPMPGQAPAGPMGTHLGMPPGATQFPPPPTAAAGGTAGGVPPPLSAPGVSNSNISNDDQMDIEMDDDDGAAPGGSGLNAQLPNAPPAMNFSQPPPMFGGNPPPGTEPPNLNDGLFNRDRQRGGMNEQRGGPGGGNSRWGGRGGGVDDGAEDNDNGGQRWRENGGSFNEGGGRMPGGRGGGGPMNIQAIDGVQQRPDFLNEFDGRGGGQGRGGGGGGRGAGNHNGDFYGNMPPNRFNQPTSLMQMRIPPPNAFNQRMGGPGGGPMFMRGGGQGGNGGGQVGAGGRPQGPGFFNPRNPFGRDNGEAGGRGGGGGMNSRGGRGGGGRGGRGNNAPPGVGGIWSDEEGDDSMNNFKRRGGGPPGAGPPGVNRFRDHRDNDDRNSRDRGGARGGGPRGMGPGNRFERDSNERDRERSRDRDRDRDSRSRGPPGTRRFSRDENSKIVDDGKKSKSQQQDTEEDWDQELEEYRPSENAKKQAAAAFNKNTPAKTDATQTKSTATTTNAHDNQKKTPIETSETAPAAQASSSAAEQEQAKEEFAKPTIAAETAAAVGNKNNDVPSSPVPAAAAPIATTTPLYDELPAAGFNNAGNDKVAETPQAKHTPQEQPPATSVTTPKVVEVTQQAAAAGGEFVPTPTKSIETQPAEIISDNITTTTATTTNTSAEATTTNSMTAVNEPKHVTAVDVSDVTLGTLKESAPEETAAEN